MRRPSARKDSPSAPLVAAEAAKALDWEQGHEWRSPPARLTLVRPEHASVEVERQKQEEAGARRLIAALAAVHDDRKQEEAMATKRFELEQRRAELTRSLAGLTETRVHTYRRNSDALALDRAGVKHERPEELVRLAEDEVTADGALRDVQRELREIDAQIALMPRPGIGARVGHALRRPRADR